MLSEIKTVNVDSVFTSHHTNYLKRFGKQIQSRFHETLSIPVPICDIWRVDQSSSFTSNQSITEPVIFMIHGYKTGG